MPPRHSASFDHRCLVSPALIDDRRLLWRTGRLRSLAEIPHLL